MRLLSFSASRLCGEAQHKRCFFVMETLRRSLKILKQIDLRHVVFPVYTRVAANGRKAITNIKQQSPSVIRIVGRIGIQTLCPAVA